MKEMFSEIRSAVLATLALAVVCCGIYPLVVFGLGQALFTRNANGSLVVDAGGNVQGSRLIGYDSTSSGGSNLGPTSQKLRDSIAQNVVDYRAQNGLAINAPVPADAVTGSGSGLDPHISLANAELQTARVAKVRAMPEAKVRELIARYTDPADLGFLGEPGVNVLELNLALDRQ
jgi:K+-transporting ATPase ATPase C chain